MAFRSIFDGAALKSEFDAAGINTQFIPVLWKHALQNPECKWDEIPSLPSAAYSILNSKFVPLSSSLHSVSHSTDGVTSKLLIQLRNGALVEAVVMRYDTRLGKYAGKPRPGGLRSTLCVSSQVGCKMGCKFCATGSMGFKSNLSTGEIVEQLVHASRISSIRNVVFMMIAGYFLIYLFDRDCLGVMRNLLLGCSFDLRDKVICNLLGATVISDGEMPINNLCNLVLLGKLIEMRNIHVCWHFTTP